MDERQGAFSSLLGSWLWVGCSNNHARTAVTWTVVSAVKDPVRVCLQKKLRTHKTA